MGFQLGGAQPIIFFDTYALAKNDQHVEFELGFCVSD
jgi:hypothetical protein